MTADRTAVPADAATVRADRLLPLVVGAIGAGGLSREPLDAGFERITPRYGFMDGPDLPADLGLNRTGGGFEPLATSFFISRPMIVSSRAGIPPDRIVELGVQVEL